MLKKSFFVAAAAASLMMIGAPAFAGEVDENYDWDGSHGDDTTVGLINVDDVASDNAINACHIHVNVLGVQVNDALNGVGLSIPVFTTEGDSEAEAGYQEACVANVASNDDN